MRQAMAGTRVGVGGPSASMPGSDVATRERAAPVPGSARPDLVVPALESRAAARRGVLLSAGRWWLRHWLRYAEVVGAQWR
ncbi:MAG TPA: hypothetical protein VK912_18950 [Longimicrobiales bacterium]|nr:hypothetical protein [Longimicrobiales bacterium]